MDFQRQLYSLVMRNGEWVRTVEPHLSNPRPVDDQQWYADLRASGPGIREEWRAFVDGGGRLPVIDDLLGGPQGNRSGCWRMAVLIRNGRAASPFAEIFPRATEALGKVPDLRHAMFSVMSPGTEHPEHWGCNAGALRFLWGVDCPEGSGLEVAGTKMDFRDDTGVLFDDTWAHSAWNFGDRPRVVILCDLVKQLPGAAGLRNRAFQSAYSHLQREYRISVPNGAEWNRALNGARRTSDTT